MSLKIALVHDWLTGMRGGEYVLEAISEVFPKADLFTLLAQPKKISPLLTAMKTKTSLLQAVPGIEDSYRKFLPVMPWVIERFDLSKYDLIISSSHCVAKGVRKSPKAVHISYVHAPMRYIWDRFEDYFGEGRTSPVMRWAAARLRKPLQNWDRSVSTPERVDHFIANSRYIAAQIQSAYGREAEVIHPFADLSRFVLPRKPGNYYLMVGAFAPNKRVDIAIEAFNRLRLPLWIVGSGQDQKRLQSLAGSTIKFLGHLDNDEIDRLYAECKAFVFPGLEDFGITPLEAMASGAPVVAYGLGGVLDSIVPGETGIFFEPQTPDALVEAIQKIEQGQIQWNEKDCRARAQIFSRPRFQAEMVRSIFKTWKNAGKSPTELMESVRLGWSSVAKETVKELPLSLFK